MVAASDLKFYRSTSQLGGAITGTQITSGIPNNVFGNVPKNELVVGEDYYKCVYLKNTHATENMDNFKLWLSAKSFPLDTELKWGFDTTVAGSGYRWSPFKNFNGSSDFVSIPDTAELNSTQFSVACWFKTTMVADAYIVNKGKDEGSVDGMNYAIHHNDDGKIRGFFWDTSDNQNEVITPLAYNDGNWHFVVFTYDGVTLRIYIDGSQKASLAIAVTPRINTKPLVIGRSSNSSTAFFSGSIDEVRVWNNDLTSGEISALHSAGTVPQTSALMYENKFGADDSVFQAQTIANFYTAPSGITWNTIGPEPSTPNRGLLRAGVAFPIWLWYHVNANAQARMDDSETFTFKFDIPAGGTGTGGTGGGTGGTGGGTGGNPPPVTTDYKIAFAGDWGCESMTDTVINLCKNYDFVMGVGDNAYASSSCWISRFTVLKPKMNSAYGNHEYEESGGTTPYKQFFSHNLTYFTFKFRNIQFFVCDTNINCDPGSTQHTFMTNALAQSQTDNTVTWRIGIMHHPWFGASSQHSYNEANAVQAFHTLFQNNGVRFVVTGHNHNWQRSKLVKYNSGSPTSPTVVTNVSPFTNDTVGLIHIISGGGGHDSGSSLYSLGSQPSFNAFQNRTHNGVWEIVSTDSGNTLTCSFVDVGGSKFDTFVMQNTVAAASNQDKYGITMLNATKSGGRTWYNKWDNGHARSWDAEPNGTSERAPDPDDSFADFHCGPGNEAIDVDGLGVCTMTGDNPRLYVNDPARVLKWNNVEMTVYYRALSDVAGASIFVHSRLAGRTEHQDEYLCCASGHTAGAFEIKKNTVIQLRKELIHPAYADDVISSVALAPYNTWIGMKLIVRDIGSNTKVEGWRDTTDGAGGGTWTKVVEKLDAGDWAFTDPTEITSYNNCSSSGSGTCVKITPKESKIQGAANSCYLRCDGTTVEFKRFSIREIDAL
jgi:Concanavalin A-like lectin/glucanases superfamily/Calcineurin-like phosphoesterase